MWNLTHSAGEFKNQMMSAPVFILLMFLLFGNLFCLPLNFSYFDIGGDKWPLKTMVTFSAFFVRFWSSLISVVDGDKETKMSLWIRLSLSLPHHTASLFYSLCSSTVTLFVLLCVLGCHLMFVNRHRPLDNGDPCNRQSRWFNPSSQCVCGLCILRIRGWLSFWIYFK